MREIIRRGTVRLPKEFIGTAIERAAQTDVEVGDIWYTDNGTTITEVAMYNGTGWSKIDV